MKLSEWLKLERGNTSRLARGINAHQPDVVRWAKEPDEHDFRACPPAKCLAIENYTEKLVTRKELRPDDYWTIWPDIEPPQEILIEQQTPLRRRDDVAITL
jgi:DNA-binding transcriptional regulator YdaS (Cro superfamily)